MGSLTSLVGALGTVSSILFILAPIGIVVAIARALRGSSISPSLVVTSWRAGGEPTAEDGSLIMLQGRPQGFKSWLLTQLKFNPTYRLTVNAANACYEANSLSGYTKRSVPVAKLTSIRHGLHRPWIAAIVVALSLWVFATGAAIPVLGTIFSHDVERVEQSWFRTTTVTKREPEPWVPYAAVILTLPISIVIGAIYYALNKRLTFGLEWGGKDCSIELRFKRSVIEGVSIDEKAFEELAAVVQTTVDLYSASARQESRAIAISGVKPVPVAHPIAPVRVEPPKLQQPAPRPSVISCSRCGRSYPQGDSRRFCDECGGGLVMS